MDKSLHGSGHAHHPHHNAYKTEKNIFIAFLLNASFSIFEFVGGIITGSIAITSDAVHDLGDALSIGIAYGLEQKSRKSPDEKHTYGYARYSLVGSIITTIILLVGSAFVIYEATKRIINPVEIDYNGMVIFAIIGLVVNGIASYVTREGDSLNQKSVNLHMLEDVLGWAVVLIGSIAMKFTGIAIIDPILTLGVASFILVEAAKNLREIVVIFLEITPKNLNLEEVKTDIKQIKGIVDIHHIHVRSADGNENHASLHVVVQKYDKKIKNSVKNVLKKHGISHSVIEIEQTDEKCEEKICK
ncbi:cation diffusion facilitator family transporter [Candidatus Nanosyncoccus alces]|uniref:Cadmium, cobalt and zinc/H(+)-K(+) antiporter n=1 Tax=Candidatus Nanosyncoccus alces TaxID=2171997 RepID=A0ABY0FKY2_9BACT|nr:cation diffusion facilitator family transporter [Candidatus Nanosyncoccus alces]RYC74416.1 Cadmium, cobalt and zinc/H(+)-K(+) antiporter [Candidatus Nanosyncoccus alces]